MNKSVTIDRFQKQKKEILAFLRDIVLLESPSQDKQYVDKCSQFILKKFSELNITYQRRPQTQIGDIYIIHYPAFTRNKDFSPMLVLTHCDTVWPVGKIKDFPIQIKADRFYGPGALDMKAGIVMIFFALKALSDLRLENKRDIFILINSAEEIGHESATGIIKELSETTALGLCLEPALPGGALKLQRKGRLVLRLSALGKAAHAGSPKKGINAIDELIFQLNNLKTVENDEITLTIGKIKGGEQINMVPDKADAFLDIRFWDNAQKQKVIDHISKLKPMQTGAQIESHIEKINPPMEKTAGSQKLLSEIIKIASSLGIKIETGRTGGSSDGATAAGFGLPVIDGLGPDGDGIHADNEHVLIPSLIERTALLAELLHRL
ncbi:MAG: M20/M25/M40 family metallo-hydrolase [Candidatus Aminicenantes bacterium]|nr:M20/M25/M40 family metallo-hydrolase [Candidatus Aminicenantes bacterium]